MGKERKSGTRTRKKLISKQKFLKAVGTILRKEGYQKLGVNRVSEIAGVDKSSLYYHFGCFDNLLEQYVLANDFWLGIFMEQNGKNVIDAGKNIITRQFETVIKNEELQALLRWELSENKGIPKYIAELREEMARDTLQQFQQYFKDTDIDMEMIAALLTSGIYYLILHRNLSTFCNVDINQKKDAERLIKTIDKIADLLVKETEEKALENTTEKAKNNTTEKAKNKTTGKAKVREKQTEKAKDKTKYKTKDKTKVKSMKAT